MSTLPSVTARYSKGHLGSQWLHDVKVTPCRLHGAMTLVQPSAGTPQWACHACAAASPPVVAGLSSSIVTGRCQTALQQQGQWSSSMPKLCVPAPAGTKTMGLRLQACMPLMAWTPDT